MIFNKKLLGHLIFLILFSFIAYGFSTYGSPSEFGNASDTTCFIGGDFGIVNCTGNITGSYYFGNGSQLTGITSIIAQNLDCVNCLGTPQIADIYLQLAGGTLLGNLFMDGANVTASHFFGNGTNLSGVNASSVNCDNIYFSGTQGSASICDGDDAFGTGGGAGVGMWVDIGSWLVPNETFAVNVNVTGDFKIQDGGDFSCIACINPADINDIDKEDIETDLNTFVDIGGDTMTGNLFSIDGNFSGIVNASIFQIAGTNILSLFSSIDTAWKLANFTPAFHNQYALTGYKKANLTSDYPNLDIDSSNDVTSVSAGAPITSTGGTTPTLSMTQSDTSTAGYLSSTDWNTFNNKGSGTVTAVTGTSPIQSSGGTTPAISIILATTSASGYLSSTDWNTFNSKSTYTASDDLIGTIAEWDSQCTDCVGTDDVATGTCDNNCLIASPTFTNPIMAIPEVQTRISPDAAGGADIGSAAKEWGNIYVAANKKIFLGNTQEAEVYFDGTKLIIKVG